MSSYVTNEALQRFKDNLDNDSSIRELKFMKLVAKMGLASDFYSIGDEVAVDYTYEGTKYKFPWIIVDFKNIEKEDEQSHPAIILETKYPTFEVIPLDAAEPDNQYANIKNYGYNRYRDSALRQWLNSDADKGSWWSSTSNTDVAPKELSRYKGFMAGFDAPFLSMVEPVKIKTVTNSVSDNGVIDITYDKFWLPSIEEVYGISFGTSDIEGTYHPYWKRRTDLDAPSNDPNVSRIITKIDGTAVSVRLRSAFPSDTSSGTYIFSNGSIGHYKDAYFARNIIVNCAIC